MLYVASIAQTTFTALDAATGTARWIYTGISTFSDPAVGRGDVYTASLDGYLYAFPTDCVGTCTPTWAVPVGTLGTNSPPTLSKGNIYVGGYDGAVYAFNATTGAALWSAQINPPNVADPLNFAPAVSEDRVFVSGDHGVYAFPGSCTTPCTPLSGGQDQILASRGTYGRRRDRARGRLSGNGLRDRCGRGTVNWKGTVTPIPHAIAVARGVAYVTTGRGELVAFAVAGCGATTCSPLWTSAPSGLSLFTPTVANGVVYVGALDFIYTQGDVVAYPATCRDGCARLATLELGGANETPLVVAGGRIYATTVNGNIDSLGLAP